VTSKPDFKVTVLFNAK